MEKFYYNDSEVRGYDSKTGLYNKYPTEQEYHEAMEEEDNDLGRV